METSRTGRIAPEGPRALRAPTLGAVVVIASLVLGGCASRFPTASPGAVFADGQTAQAVFDRCLAAHGGDVRELTTDVNLSMDGRWDSLILRIQPLVTDASFRISSQERYRPRENLYAVLWQGPAGTKKVVRTPATVEVYYNGVRETDEKTLQAAAMTADAFQLFHLGPSFIRQRNATLTRIADAREEGVSYRRVLATLRPGFGFSPEDQVVLWIEARTSRLFRVHMTLEGFETTRGAHVDTTFLDYRQVGGLLVPVRFHERVRGPLRISAHRWWLTGAELGRDWPAEAVAGPAFTGKAEAPARALP